MSIAYRVKRKPGKNKHYYCNNCNAVNDPSRQTCVQCGHGMADRRERRRK